MTQHGMTNEARLSDKPARVCMVTFFNEGTKDT